MEDIILVRIQNNDKLFTEEELKIIENNDNIVKKIYKLALLDGYFCKM